MNYSLETILEGINKDVEWHSSELKRCCENSPNWNFHLGWVDALTSYRWKIQELVKVSKSS